MLILSDRDIDAGSHRRSRLLATAAVHHHLIREGLRTRVGLIVETGEAREVMHFALLIGYGAEAVNPYLAFETIDDRSRGRAAASPSSSVDAASTTSRRIDKGLLKMMSKMGISTYPVLLRRADLRGDRPRIGLRGQVFHRHRHRASAASGLEEIAAESARAPPRGIPDVPISSTALEAGGEYAGGDATASTHLWNPEAIAALQHAARGNTHEELHAHYAQLVNDQSEQLMNPARPVRA